MEYVIKDNKIQKNKFKKLKAYFSAIFASPKKTVLYTGALLFILLMIYFLFIFLYSGSFYNNGTDDYLQYYPMMCNFISRLKGGDWSLYNLNNYLGASVFSDTYYIPLDAFTFVIFIFSFIMETEIAMSLVELIKLVLGVMALCTYLGLIGTKPKYIHFVGLLYFSSAGITNFFAFPCFSSMAFYLPFSLIIGHYFLKGKWYLVPLYAMLIVFYNFYLAYTVFAFMCFSMIFMAFIQKRKILKVLTNTVFYVLLILLGLCMAMAVFMPSYFYITRSTTRSVVEENSVANLISMFKSYLEYILTYLQCLLKLLKNSPNIGLFKNSKLIFDSFYELRCLKNTMDVNKYTFNIEVFFRILNNTYVPATSSSYYGYLELYSTEHMSLYITGVGLLISSYVWFMKDYKSKVFKAMLVLIMILMSVPFFSYILSANLSVLYTRWMNVIPIPLLLITAHVLNENETFNLKPKHLVTAGVVLAYFALFSSYHHLEELSSIALKYNWGEDLINFEKVLFFSAVIALVALSGLLLGLHFAKRSDLKKLFTVLVVILFIALLAGILIFLVGKYNVLPDGVFNTTFSGSTTKLYSVDVQMLGQYITLLTLGFIIVAIFAITNKKKKLLIVICTMEFIISACFSFAYGAYASVVSKQYDTNGTSFNQTHELTDFLNANISEPDIYRIYIDSSISGTISYNIARLMPTGTNQLIFHSFINGNTDKISYYLGRYSADEGQAGKSYLANLYSNYLNIFLGYKYVVISSSTDEASFDTNYFSMVAKNDKYTLLEFKNYEEFLVYSQYVQEDNYLSLKNSLSQNAKYRFLINYAVIEEEFEEYISSVLTEKDVTGYDDADNIIETETAKQAKTIAVENRLVPVQMTNDLGVTALYYKYAFTGEDAISTKSYVVNLYNSTNNSHDSASQIQEYIDNHEIFLEFEDGHISYTSILKDSTMGSTCHIPIYRNDATGDQNTLKYLYVKAGNQLATESPTIEYSVEAIFPSTDEIVRYESGEVFSYSGLTPYVRFPVKSSISDKTLIISTSATDISISGIIIEYEDGSLMSSPQEVSLEKEIKYIYINKYSSNLYKRSSSANITCTFVEYNLEDAYTDTLINKEVTTKGSKITISYDNTAPSEGKKIIMIPTGYSNEWQVVEGEAEIIKVNGGFIGLVVDASMASNTITIKFVPDGFNKGLIISAVAIAIYLLMLAAYMLFIRKRTFKRSIL